MQNTDNERKVMREDTKNWPSSEIPRFTSVDPRPPEFPPENNDKVMARWAGRIFNVQRLLQLLIDGDDYFQKNEILLNKKNFEEHCHGALSLLGCNTYSDLITFEIIIYDPINSTHSLNPIIKKMRFLVLDDAEWSVFDNVLRNEQIPIKQLAKLTDFNDGGNWNEFRRQSALWNIILSKKLHGVFVVETEQKPGGNIEIWIRLNRCLQKDSVVQRVKEFS